MTTKTKRIPELHVGRGQQVGPLTVFPVWTGAPAIAGLVMGLAAEVSVAEREGSPVVGELIVTNNGREPALLVEGELLEGGWQHRALTQTVLVEANSTSTLPVVCVEAGRWGGASIQRLGNKSAPVGVRRAIRGLSKNDQGFFNQASVASIPFLKSIARSSRLASKFQEG